MQNFCRIKVSFACILMEIRLTKMPCKLNIFRWSSKRDIVFGSIIWRTNIIKFNLFLVNIMYFKEVSDKVKVHIYIYQYFVSLLLKIRGVILLRRCFRVLYRFLIKKSIIKKNNKKEQKTFVSFIVHLTLPYIFLLGVVFTEYPFMQSRKP